MGTQRGQALKLLDTGQRRTRYRERKRQFEPRSRPPSQTSLPRKCGGRSSRQPSSFPRALDERRRRAGDDGGDAPRVSVIQFVADRAELALFELVELDAAPSMGGPDDGRVHQLENGPLAERVRSDLGAATLFEEQALQEIRRADHEMMPGRKPLAASLRR